jgi:hypothetical protein
VEDHPDLSKHLHLIRSSIEHLEMDYLKAIAAGPGWPIFFLIDLDDPAGLDMARKIAPPERTEATIADAKAKGLAPILVFIQILSQPYHEGDHWWKGCRVSQFPILATTDGQSAAFARDVPEGIDDALRRRFLVEHTPAVVRSYLGSKAAGMDPIVVVIADLSDVKGFQAASNVFGEGVSRSALVTAADGGYVPAVPWSGAPTGSMYPEAWGGPLPEGHYAVQVIAHGGVSNLVLAEPV